jgi:hypothetical protein
MQNKGLNLGQGPIFPLLLKMSWPSIIAMLAVALANLIDAYWLAKLSTQALAALTVCFPIQMIFAAIGIGTGADVRRGSIHQVPAGSRSGHFSFRSPGDFDHPPRDARP